MTHIALHLLVFTLFLSACSDMKQSVQKLEDGTVRLGALLSYTGPLSRYSRGIWYGGKLAVQEINAQGGVDGKPLELILADDKLNPAAAEAGAVELRDLGVQGVLGSVASSITMLSAEKVFTPAGIPLISASSTSPKISTLDDKDTVWRTAASDAYQGEFLATKVFADGSRKAAVIFINNAYGSGLAERFAEVYKSLGGTVVQKVAYPSDKDKDFGAEVAQALTGLQAGDALMIFGYVTDTANIGNALDAASPLDIKYWGCDGNFGTAIVELSSLNFLRRLRGSNARPASGERYEIFRDTFEKGTGRSVEAYSSQAYDAVYLMALAMAQAGTPTSEGIIQNLRKVSGSGGTKVYPNEFAKAVQLIKAATPIDYSGVSGEVDFDSNGDITIDPSALDKFYYVWQLNSASSAFEEVMP